MTTRFHQNVCTMMLQWCLSQFARNARLELKTSENGCGMWLEGSRVMGLYIAKADDLIFHPEKG
jgi:hypothetical protein